MIMWIYRLINLVIFFYIFLILFLLRIVIRTDNLSILFFFDKFATLYIPKNEYSLMPAEWFTIIGKPFHVAE